MMVARSWLRHLTSGVLAAFLAAAVVPRAAFYEHSHADGGHAHVHGESAAVHEHAHPHDHPHPHSHSHPHEGTAAGGPLLTPGDPGEGRHTHWQSLFDRATTGPTPVLVRGEACVTVAATEPRRSPADELPPARSRAPPVLLSA
jgi:hypothetical protein